MSTWRVERLRGGAGELHARDALASAWRSVTVLDVDAPALVLGSTQRDDVVDRAAADRLDVEFNVPIEVGSTPYEAIRLTDERSAKRLREIGGIRILQRGDGELVALFESRYRLQRIENDEPELTLEDDFLLRRPQSRHFAARVAGRQHVGNGRTSHAATLSHKGPARRPMRFPGPIRPSSMRKYVSTDDRRIRRRSSPNRYLSGRVRDRCQDESDHPARGAGWPIRGRHRDRASREGGPSRR